MVQHAKTATVAIATMLFPRNANTMSPEKKRRTEMKRRAGSVSTSVEIWNLAAPLAKYSLMCART